MTTDPRAPAELVVAVRGAPGVGASALAVALLDVPSAMDADLARFAVVDASAPEASGAFATVLVTRAAPGPEAADAIAAEGDRLVFVAVHAADLASEAEVDARLEAWRALVPPPRVHATATPGGAPPRGVDGLRAALFAEAIDRVGLAVDEARRRKRPFAAGIIAGAVLAAASEALVPGAAAFVAATQAGAISALSYLYTGAWLGRTQALTLLPMFAAEAAGGSVFLFVKSFLPPTGVADAAAALVAATLTVSVLGAVAWVLERGRSLDDEAELTLAFRRLKARTAAERAALLRNRARFGERSFWVEVVERLVFGT